VVSQADLDESRLSAAEAFILVIDCRTVAVKIIPAVSCMVFNRWMCARVGTSR
jgi:hypothetical protein